MSILQDCLAVEAKNFAAAFNTFNKAFQRFEAARKEVLATPEVDVPGGKVILLDSLATNVAKLVKEPLYMVTKALQAKAISVRKRHLCFSAPPRVVKPLTLGAFLDAWGKLHAPASHAATEVPVTPATAQPVPIHAEQGKPTSPV